MIGNFIQSKMKNRLFFYFCIWTIIACSHFIGNYLHNLAWGIKFNWLKELPYTTGWCIWFFITPLAVFFAQRFQYSKLSLLHFFLFNYGAYLLLNFIQIITVTTYVTIFNNWILEPQTFESLLSRTLMPYSFYNFLIYGIIVVLINYYYNLRAEQYKSTNLEKELLGSRMMYLKQQLRPHFLFNTHHSIITLMKMGERDKAINMMERLSDIMRFALRENAQQEVPLYKEIDLLNSYLQIQKVRFENKLIIEILVADELKNAFVPSMIMQPLVENCIKHALEVSTGMTKIFLSANKVGSDLVLTVRDEGEQLNMRFPLVKGIGISNTEERLKNLYGTRQSLAITTFQNGKQGTEVTVKIPLHYE